MSITTLSSLAEQEAHFTLEDLVNPLLNGNHTHRVPLCKQGKECGTTMPLVLFSALKLYLLEDAGLDEEPAPEKGKQTAVTKQANKMLRHLLVDIYRVIEGNNLETKDVLLSKTFQGKVFNFIVHGETMAVREVTDILMNTAVNRAHTVSGNKSPSFTVPSFLCRWLLMDEGLNIETDFTRVNVLLKRTGGTVFAPLIPYEKEDWATSLSFSRRVQNHIMFDAFKTGMKKSMLAKRLYNEQMI
jgi:hypothetical protein